MSLVFAGLLFLMILLAKAGMGTLKTPVLVFSIIWCIVGLGANLCLYEYYAPSNLVNTIIISGAIIFFIVYGFGLRGVKKSFFTENIKLDSCFINLRILIGINIVVIVLLLPSLITALIILRTNELWYIRANGSEVYSSSLMATLADSVIRPLFVATTILAIVYLFSDGKQKTKYVLLMLAIVENIELVISTAGRAPIVNFLFYFIIAIVLFRGKSIFELLHHERGKLLFVVALIMGIFVLTQMRSSTNLDMRDMLETFYNYYFSGPSYLTQLLRNVTEYGIDGRYFWGAATFGFISNIFSNILILVTGRPQGTLYIIGSVITSKQYWVGEHTLLNAMCTGFYPFLLDWGYLGIVIGPVILGIITTIITKKVYKNRSLFYIAIYIYWIYALFRTVFKWDLVNIDFSVVLISLYFFTHKCYKVGNDGCRA